MDAILPVAMLSFFFFLWQAILLTRHIPFFVCGPSNTNKSTATPATDSPIAERTIRWRLLTSSQTRTEMDVKTRIPDMKVRLPDMPPEKFLFCLTDMPQ